MLEGLYFGILGTFYYSKLLYGKMRTDHIYNLNNNDPHGPNDLSPNREGVQSRRFKWNEIRSARRPCPYHISPAFAAKGP